MKRTMILTGLVMALVIGGCSEDNELTQTVYYPDAEYTDLPAYSEWGYNTFGVYYEREPFVASGKIPAKVVVTGGRFTFRLTGRMYGGDWYSSDSNEMSLEFVLGDFAPKTYTELTALNDTVFDLADERYAVVLTDGAVKTELDLLSGNLQFKRAQHLLVDNRSVEAILSGRFEFKFIRDGEPVTFSNGRFDVGIGYDNFYNY